MRRRGWCPTLDEPMQTGDGLLVRVKPPGATLTPAQAMALADASAGFGNGVMELTQRGNIQVRGLRGDTVGAFAAAMRAAGLALPPELERRRAVMPPPLLGTDPTIAPGTAALVAALEQACADDPRLDRLPGKFAIAVEAGGVLGGRAVAASLVVRGDGTVAPGGGEDAPPLAGPLPYGDGRMAFALAPPFAQFDAAMLRALADVAARHATTLRVTPWRALLLGSAAAGQDIGAEAEPAWISDAADPRLRVVACIGSGGCASGTRPARSDAARLAPPASGVLHVSGCPKGCAHPGPAALTLVAWEGQYHEIRNGRAQDVMA